MPDYVINYYVFDYGFVDKTNIYCSIMLVVGQSQQPLCVSFILVITYFLYFYLLSILMP